MKTDRRLRRGRILLACLVLAALAVGAVLVLGRGEQTRLALRFQPGQTLRYRLTARYQGTQGSPATAGFSAATPFSQLVSETLVWRVASVGGDGTAVVDVRLTDVTLNGRPTAAPLLGNRVRLVVATDGRVLSASDPGILAGPSFPGLDQVAPVLPAGTTAVRPGASWRRSFTQAYALGGGLLPYRASGRFVGVGSEGGTRAAIVRTTTAAPVHASMDLSRALAFAGRTGGAPANPGGQAPTITYQGTVAGGQTSWLDASAGVLVRTDAMVTFDVTMDFEGFPSLFPTFDPGEALNPFGGLAPGTSSGTVELRGTTAISLRLIQPE